MNANFCIEKPSTRSYQGSPCHLVAEGVECALKLSARRHADSKNFMRSVRISLFPRIPKIVGFYDFYDFFIYAFATLKANAIEKTPHIA